MTLRGPTIAADFKTLVEEYIEKRFGPGGDRRATPAVPAEVDDS